MESAGRDDEIGRRRDEMRERAEASRRGELPPVRDAGLAERRKLRDAQMRALLEGQQVILRRLDAVDSKADMAITAVTGAYQAAGMAAPAAPEPRRPELRLIRGEAV